SRSKPLHEIRARAEPDFQHALVTIACKLREGMDEWLIEIAMRFELLKVVARKLVCDCILGPAALTVPEFPHLLFQTFHGRMTFVPVANFKPRYCGHGQQRTATLTSSRFARFRGSSKTKNSCRLGLFAGVAA